MSRNILLGIVFLLVLASFLLPGFLMKQEEKKINKNKKKICFGENCFEVEIARTAEERRQGLMFRESLEARGGMLFDFGQSGRFSFWMKNTLIPLDIIWLDSGKQIVFIKNNAQPCLDNQCKSIAADKEARYVLEINGGTAEEIGLTLGSQMVFALD